MLLIRIMKNCYLDTELDIRQLVKWQALSANVTMKQRTYGRIIGALITCTAAILFIVYVRDTSHIGYDGLRMFDEFHLKEPGLDMT